MKKQFLLSIVFCFITASVYPQQFEFSHLDNTKGISNNEIKCIFKDSRGFLWIGTHVGLNRYDGVNFKIYKQARNNPDSPSFDAIHHIAEDINGNLWLLGSGNLYIIYDWRAESFINNTDSVLNHMGLPSGPTKIEIDKDKNLFLAYPAKGIYKYDIQSKKITQYHQSEQKNDFDLSDITDITGELLKSSG